MAKDKIESLADTIINLTPQEAQKLQVVIKAKMMPEIEKQKALLEEQGANPQVQEWHNLNNKQWHHQQLVILHYEDC
jgi:ketol-acid reductoisomerase